MTESNPVLITALEYALGTVNLHEDRSVVAANLLSHPRVVMALREIRKHAYEQGLVDRMLDNLRETEEKEAEHRQAQISEAEKSQKSLTTIYECTRNSDQTEGKGVMIAFAWTEDLESAIAQVRRQGVMGVGDGDVYEIAVGPEATHKDYGTVRPGLRHLVYGYHRNWRGQWVEGRVEDTEIPESEKKDYAEYRRLAAKFGGR